MITWRIILFMVPFTLPFLSADRATAQGGDCVTGGLLRVDAAFSRPGAGGTFNYSVQVSNLSNRPITFRATFRMTNAQVNPELLRRNFTLPVHGSGILVLGNGTEISTLSRIGGGVSLNCLSGVR